MRKVLLLINPVFRQRCGRVLPRVLDVFHRAGVQATVEETKPGRAAGLQAKQAVAIGFDAIVVGGGDGTVFDVLQGLAGSEAPLGILPFGTGNVLAQNLKIPKDPVRAARWLLSSRPLESPLGRIICSFPEGDRSWFFAIAGGMGPHAAVMAAVRRSEKKMGGRAAYYAAGLRVLRRYPFQPFDIEIATTDGRLVRRRVNEAIALRVAKLNFWRPGGGLTLPFLRLLTVEGDSRWRLAQTFLAAFAGSGGARDRQCKQDACARYEDALRVVCRPAPELEYKMPLPVEADGESLAAPSAAVIEMAGTSVNFLSRFSG